MGKIYALSDIHGCLSPLKEALTLITLKPEDRVILLLLINSYKITIIST